MTAILGIEAPDGVYLISDLATTTPSEVRDTYGFAPKLHARDGALFGISGPTTVTDYLLEKIEEEYVHSRDLVPLARLLYLQMREFVT